MAISRMLTVKPHLLENLTGKVTRASLGLKKPSLSEDEHLSHANTAPCIQIRRLVSGYDPAVRRGRWILVMAGEAFQAVLDESGYQAGRSQASRRRICFCGVSWHRKRLGRLRPRLGAYSTREPEGMSDACTVKKLVRWHGPLSDNDTVQTIKAAIEKENGLASIRWRLPYNAYRAVVLNRIVGAEENLYFHAWFGRSSHLLGIVTSFLTQPWIFSTAARKC